MDELISYSIGEIKARLKNGEFPFSGITKAGSAEFHFEKPAFFAGIALHAGHKVRPEILPLLALSEKERFRDEDPFTDCFINHFPIRVVARDSRFEYDLNRERHRCIYDTYVNKWKLKVWKDMPDEMERKISLDKYDEFYSLIDILTDFLATQSKHALIFDMHSFCYQRYNEIAWQQDPRPEINAGTKAANRVLFHPVISKITGELSKTYIGGRNIRVAENEIFYGGYLSRRISRKYFNQILVLSLEYKKIFMDEMTGVLFPEVLNQLVSDFLRSVKETSPLF
jgi:hypothetical protein